MWEIIIIILAVLFIAKGMSSVQQGGGDSSLYYEQHSRYPWGSWWIPFSEPSHRCHRKARVHCQPHYFYDNCYERVLKQCNRESPPPCPPKDLLAWGDITV
jgi:hypothetical protein